MKKTSLFLIAITIICLLCQCQKKEKLCKDFSTDELSWIPYTNGKVANFKGDLTSSTLTIIANKTSESFSSYTPFLQPHGCKKYVEWKFSCTDSINVIIEMTNNAGKKKYSYWMDINGIRQVESGVASNTITKTINGITYLDVLTLKIFSHFDTVYYGKNEGFIAFHKKSTNEWFYKQ